MTPVDLAEKPRVGYKMTGISNGNGLIVNIGETLPYPRQTQFDFASHFVNVLERAYPNHQVMIDPWALHEDGVSVLFNRSYKSVDVDENGVKTINHYDGTGIEFIVKVKPEFVSVDGEESEKRERVVINILKKHDDFLKIPDINDGILATYKLVIEDEIGA